MRSPCARLVPRAEPERVVPGRPLPDLRHLREGRPDVGTSEPRPPRGARCSEHPGRDCPCELAREGRPQHRVPRRYLGGYPTRLCQPCEEEEAYRRGPCLVLSCVPSCPVLSCPVSHPVLSCPVLVSPVPPCPVLSCPALSCPVLSCIVLSCLVLSRLVLSCLALFCTRISRGSAWTLRPGCRLAPTATPRPSAASASRPCLRRWRQGTC